MAFFSSISKNYGGEGETLVLGDSYLRITIIGPFFWIYGLAGNMIVRAEGKMKSAAVMMGLGLIVNVIANYILMVVFDFGVKEAAWGTNIGMFVYTLTNWIYFSKGFSSFKTKVFAIYRDKDIITQTIGLGISSLIMSVMTVIQGVVVLNPISKYGTVSDLAFYGSTFRVFNFLLTPIFGLMRALQPVVGINYGAKQYERAIDSFKIFAVASTSLTLPFWLVSMISPESVLGLISDKIINPTNLVYFRLNMSILLILSIIFMAMTFFPSINKGKPAAIIGIARQLIFYIPAMIVLPKMIGVAGVYYGGVVIDSIIVLWTAIMVKKEFNILRRKDEKSRLKVA
nr:MATE family efflux transporter [Tissierella sp. P1]